MCEADRKNLFARHGLADWIGILLLLFISFPYVQILPSGSYTQPTALIFAGFFLCCPGGKIYCGSFSDCIALFGLAFLGVFVFLFTCFPYGNVQEYKYLINYLSPVVITLASLQYLINHPQKSKIIFQFSILIWVGVAVVQRYSSPTFATGLLGPWGEYALDIMDSGRGVLGLAPEPTHHAFHILILAACLVQIDRSRFSRMLILLCIFDAVIIAASSSAVLVLGLATLLLFLFNFPKWTLLFVLVFVISWMSGFSIDWTLPGNSRLFVLINAMLLEPTSLLSADYSLNIRLGGMFATLMAAWANVFFPFGMDFSSWDSAREGLLKGLPWLMDLSENGPPSGIGVLLFQIGGFALLFFWRVFSRVLDIRVGVIERIVLLSIPFVFLSQYYISAPSFSLLYACALMRLHILERVILRASSPHLSKASPPPV